MELWPLILPVPLWNKSLCQTYHWMTFHHLAVSSPSYRYQQPFHTGNIINYRNVGLSFKNSQKTGRKVLTIHHYNYPGMHLVWGYSMNEHFLNMIIMKSEGCVRFYIFMIVNSPPDQEGGRKKRMIITKNKVPATATGSQKDQGTLSLSLSP